MNSQAFVDMRAYFIAGGILIGAIVIMVPGWVIVKEGV